MRKLALVTAATFVCVVVGGVALGAGAQTAPAELGSFAIVATAPGFEVTEDSPSAQAHPEGHGAVPQTSTLLANGGIGYGLAAVVWPGATAANGGALLGLLVPSQVGGQPVPDAIGGAAREVAPSANYPIKAEARMGSTPDASFDGAPGVVMTAHADPARVAAEGALERAEQPGAATFGNVRSNSESTLAGTVGRALATSAANDIDLGGVVKIKSVTSTATAQTDGKTSSGAGGTVVSGMTIAEQPAYVDDQGVHIGEQGQPANAVASQIANQALAEAGYRFYVSQPTVETSGATTTTNAGSLYVVWKPPNNPSENVFTFTFGGARVSVTAGEGFGSELEVAADTDLPPSEAAGGGDLAPGGSVDSGELAVAPPAPASGGGPTRTEAISDFRGLGASFGGFGWGWLVLALLVMTLAGVGSRRLLADLLDRPAVDCPLERDR